jgi:hypothetical protein
MDDRLLSSSRDVAVGTSHDRPAPLGVTVKTKIERGDRYSAPEVYTLEIALLESVRGGGVLDRIVKEGIAGDPEAGFEYVMVRGRIGYFSKGRGFGRQNDPYTAEPDYFRALASATAVEYPLPTLIRQPEPSLVGVSLSAGDVKEGWIVLLTAEKDEHPFVTFKREYRENLYGLWAPVWFQL